ncbi:MAG: Gfo/Idh/MocA family oxidoreductase [Faecalibacterium sp.]
MKILIVGLGSMGKRRARLVKGMRPEIEICGVDRTEARRAEAEGLGIAAYDSIAAAVAAQQPDAALVCTAPITHAGIITALLQAGLPVFTELNLVDDGYAENTALAAQKNLPLFLSSTMLYRGETQFIKGQVEKFWQETGKPVRYIYHIGQYLPDWHPWENYKNFFVGDKRTGGVREIFGIDLPWLVDAFGEVESVQVQKDKISALELDYPDSYLVTLCHKNGTKGVLAVDIVSPKAVRNFECYGEGLHLFWEGNPKALYQFDTATGEKTPVNTYEAVEHDSRYSDNIVENAYVDELANFFAMLEQGEAPRWSFAQDQAVIDLIEQIEA